MCTGQTVAPTDKLTFRYIAAYLVEGLRPPGDSLLLFSDVGQGKKIYLTGHTHEGLCHIDTAVAIANLILNASFQNGILDFGEVRNHLAKVYQERIQRYGASCALLVVEASHEQEAVAIGQIGQSDNREFCLALPNGFMDETRGRHKKFLDQVLAFLAFSMPSVSGFERVGHCIVANHPSGKPLYVLSFGMTGRLSVSSDIPAAGAELFAALNRHSSDLDAFQTAFRLAAGSASSARDNLRAFLFAFTALEVFVGKFSNQYGTQLDLLTEKDRSPKIQAHLERLRREEKENVLSYRFARVSSYLGLGNLDEIIDEFDRANKCRNDIVHGKDFDESTFPTAKVRSWLGELVQLHIAREPMA